MAVFEAGILEDRRRRIVQALGDDSPLVLIGAGQPIHKPGGHDQTYPFAPHPKYFWLTGSVRWGGVLAFDAREGWTHFVRPVTEGERLWEGSPEGVEGEDVAGLLDWLEQRAGERIVALGSPVEGVEGDPELTETVRAKVEGVRRVIDAAELDLLERAVRATTAGHARAREVIRPGVSEREIQIEMEAEMFRQGAHAVGYGSIVGVGSHAAVLHFEPGERVVGSEDLVLIDAGGAISGYTADVTRTYAGGDRFTPEQQAIYDVVLAAEQEGISKCQVGTEWHDVHRAAAGVIALGLRDLGLLRGDVEGLLDSEAIALFFPHGVGHMVGPGVRGVGGRAPGRSEEIRYCGARIRVDLPLEENFLMTVEPGVYFVPALLDDPEQRERFRDAVAWDALEAWRAVGGIRIEDNVLVTADGPQVITALIPK